jgi:death-on-curing protein
VNESEIRFLSLDHVLTVHDMQIERYGGSPGIRDRGLLESAVAMPQASFGGVFLHQGLHENGCGLRFPHRREPTIR